MEGRGSGPRRLAVLGRPVAHSRSPAMQKAALEALGLGEDWLYEAIDVGADQFESRVRALPGEGFVGVNVTVPHKQSALSLADRRSEVAREIGAANTLTFDADGIRADNTDAEGLMAAIEVPLARRRALVLGAGGAARAVVWALLREGAEVDVWNRTPQRAAALTAELGGTMVESPRDERPEARYEVIVNCTAVGLQAEDPFDELPLKPGSFGAGQLVVDLVYGDEETALLLTARGAGADVIDGIEVLVRQGAASLRIWTGLDPPLSVMRAAARGG